MLFRNCIAFELSVKVEVSSRLVVTVWSRKPVFWQEVDVLVMAAVSARIVKIVRVFGAEKPEKYFFLVPSGRPAPAKKPDGGISLAPDGGSF